MSSGQDPKVTEQGGYSDAGHGPDQDSAAFTKQTPFAGPRLDEAVTESGEGRRDPHADQPQYVFDETERKATPAGMLSRNAVREKAAAVDKGEEGNQKLMIGGAIVAFLILVVLGAVGVMSNNKQLDAIDAEAAAAAAAKPELPEDVQGVKVRKGMKHTPAAPAKTPGETLDNAQEVELNAVPDGAPPPDVELEEPSDDVPDPSAGR